MRRLLGVTMMTALASSAAAQSHLARPVIDTVNHHIVRVMNPGPTAWPDTNGWKLVLDHVVQPPDGSPGELGDPSGVVVLSDGRVVVYDEKPASINLYDAQGRFLHAISREGSGPGEFRRPELAVFHDTLVIHDPQLTRGTFLTLDGKVLRSFPTVCCHFGLPISVDDRGRLRVGSSSAWSGRRTQYTYFDRIGKHVDSMIAPDAIKQRVWIDSTPGGGSTTFYVPLAGQNSRGFLHDGRIVFGGTDSYTFFITRNGRDTLRIFGRAGVTAVPVSDAKRDSLFHQIVDRNPRGRAVARESDIPHTYPLWDNIWEDGAGNLWVDRAAHGNSRRQFDVFRSDGIFLGSVPAPFQKGWVISVNGPRLAVLDTDDNDLPRIRIYRIDRSGH